MNIKSPILVMIMIIAESLAMYMYLVLPLFFLIPGQSLHFSPNQPQVRFESGRRVAEIECLLDNDDFGNNGAFTWTGPALDNSAVMGHTSISLDSSGTVSTLTINNVVAGDAGQYSCSYAGAQVFITLVVVGTYSESCYTSITTIACIWISHLPACTVIQTPLKQPI